MSGRSDSLPIPGLRWGTYPQRGDGDVEVGPRRAPGRWARLAEALGDVLGDGLGGGPGGGWGGGLGASLTGTSRHRRRPGSRNWARRVARIQARARSWQALDEAAFDRLRLPRVLQARFARDGMVAGATDAAAAFVVEAARRALGRSAYDGQIQAAIAMTGNVLVEMATGEGKSLATALAAGIAGLAGIPVHVLTANDYLVARDAEAFKPLFTRLGLTVATVLAETQAPARRDAYRCSIVYATAREVAFDYLRDRMNHPGCGHDSALVERLRRAENPDGGPLMRGLCLAILDEADSILIDEAQMPLILSREQRDPAAHAAMCQAWMLSSRLAAGRDFQVLEKDRTVLLEAVGRDRLEQLAAPLARAWKNRLHREQLILAALTARHALVRDRDYLVTTVEGKAGQPTRQQIELIDAVTGRIAVGRRWSAGIHALVAIKEGLKPEADLETIDRITFQRFFRRYHRLGGSSGTLTEASGELRRVYGLSIVPVAPRLPLRRVRGATRWFADDASRDRALVERVRALAARGRPVLIGTDSVADTRRIATCLRQAGVDHAVLDARFDAEEARLVARAGEAGMVTVSTNMAGRGTDIQLTEAARAAGGLHVLLCQHNASRRHDRQLAGRAGRQGDPGSVETWLSMAFRGYAGGKGRHPAAAWLSPFIREAEVRLPGPILDAIQQATQRGEELRQQRQRARMLREDRQFQQSLAFSGPG